MHALAKSVGKAQAGDHTHSVPPRTSPGASPFKSVLRHPSADLLALQGEQLSNRSLVTNATSHHQQSYPGAYASPPPSTDSSSTWDASEVISRFFDCLNSHDLATMFSLLAPEVTYNNTALQVHCVGKQAVVKFYVEVLSSIPKGSMLILDEVSDAPEPQSPNKQAHTVRRMNVAWHLELGGVPVLGSEGKGLYRLDTRRGLLTELRDTPQAAVSVLLPALAMATPAINFASPVLMPALNLVADNLPRGGFPQDPAAALLQDMANSAADSIKGLLVGGSDTQQQPLGGVMPWTSNVYGPSTASLRSGSAAPYTPGNGAGPYGNGTNKAGYQNTAPTASGQTTSPQPRVWPASNQQVESDAPAYGVPMRPLSPEPITGTMASLGSAVAPEAGKPYAFAFTSPQPETTAETARTANQGGFAVDASLIEESDAEDESEGGSRSESVTLGPDEDPEGGEVIVQPASFVDLKSPPAKADLTGVWEKDVNGSQPEAYERMLDVMGLTGLQRVTARLIEGVELKQTEEGLTVNYLTVVPFFKVTEAVKFGRPASLNRRDLKPGKQTAIAEHMPGGVRLRFEWGAPGAGSLIEEYTVVTDGSSAQVPDEMVVTSHLKVGDKSASVSQVYRRSSKNRDQLLKESRARNNSLESVLDRQRKQFGN